MAKEEEMLALFNKNWHHEEAEVAKKEKEVTNLMTLARSLPQPSPPYNENFNDLDHKQPTTL